MHLPLPPKYLEVQGADGKLETIENPARAKAESIKRSLRKIEQNPNMPKQIQLVQRGATPYIHADFTAAPPKKDYSAPAHRFKAKNSSSEFKGASANVDKLRQQLENADFKHVMRNNQDLNSIGTNIYADGENNSALGPPVTGRSAPPQYVGSSYAHLPNAGKKGILMHIRPRTNPKCPARTSHQPSISSTLKRSWPTVLQVEKFWARTSPDTWMLTECRIWTQLML